MATAGDVLRPFPDWAEPGPALDALYAAFADWPRPTGPFCDQCFDDESTAAILRPVPLREARPRERACRAVREESTGRRSHRTPFP